MNDFSKPHYFLRNKNFKTQDTSIDVKFLLNIDIKFYQKWENSEEFNHF